MTCEEPNRIQLYSWGLIPAWVKDKSQVDEFRVNTLNARNDTVLLKPSWRSIKKKRCLILVGGFFDWMDINETKYPHYIRLKDTSHLLLEVFMRTGLIKTLGNYRYLQHCNY